MPRLRVVEKTVFTFEELSERAKESAREWWRQSAREDFDGDCVIEDARQIADILGVDLKTRGVRLMGGGTRQKPCIWWSGFSSQGDGACFEGRYAYKAGSCKAIRAYAPQDKTLHAIADSLAAAQKPFFYRLEARATHSGPYYYHEYCMAVEVSDTRTGDCGRDLEDAETAITEALRDFARWIYRQLEADYDYYMSPEHIDDCLEANRYEFTEDGDFSA